MVRKSVKIAAALGLLGASVTAIHQSQAGFALSPNWARWLAAPKGVSFTSIETDLARRSVTLHGVRTDRGAVQIAAESVTLPLPATSLPLVLAQAGGTPQASGTAVATGVTIKTDANVYAIKRIELTGTNLSNNDLAALLDPASPGTLEAKLQKISAKSALITGLTSDKDTPEGKIHGDVSQIELTGIVQGRVGAARTPGITISGLGVKGAGTVKTGVVEASGLDLALLDRLLNTVRTDDHEALKPLADALAVHDISVINTGNNTALTVALVTEKGLKARPLKTSLHDIHDAVKADGAVPGPGGDEEAKADQTKAVAEDILSSYEASSFGIGKFVLTTSNEDGPVTAGIGQFSLNDFRNRAFGALSVRDFSIGSPRVKAAFATFDVTSLTVPPFAAPSPSDTQNDLTTDHLPFAAKADLTKLSVDVSADAEDETHQGYKFNIAHVGSTTEKTAGSKAVQNNVSLDNVTFDLNPGSDRPGARNLLDMGYKSIDLSALVTAKFDQDKETLSIQKFNLNGTGLGSATLAIDLVNVNKGVFSSNPAISKASALAVLLKRTDLRLVEGGLVDKFIAFKARQDGKSVTEERAAEQNFFAVELPGAAGNDPALKTIGGAVAKFIGAPKNLHISIASADGIGVTDLGLINDPAALLSRLDIHAEANQ